MEANPSMKIGNGIKTSFWHDEWIDQIPLKDQFPDLFHICANPEARVSDCWSLQGWNISFRWLLNDWIVERVATLLGKLGGASTITSEANRRLTKHKKDGAFTLTSAYKRCLEVAGGSLYYWNYFWKSIIPTKVKCFTWLVIKRACLPQEVLQKTGRQLVPRCFLSNMTGETNKHHFLHCSFTTKLWSLILNIIGYS